MPIINESSYKRRPWHYFNAYLETLVPYFTTKTHWLRYERERLELEDGDFLDLDWIRKGARSLIVISHGFEGNSRDHFIEQSASYLADEHDILVWHYRSCSQELNRLPRFYHVGDLPDLEDVIRHAVKENSYSNVILLGFSMGGSIVTNYLGSERVHSSVKGGVVFSAPMDLKGASQQLQARPNRYLMASFLNKWKGKIRRKAGAFPDLFDLGQLDSIMDLEVLFETYVLPCHRFETISEYYKKWSSTQFIENIALPLLIVNAQNDPMLSKGCYPHEACARSEAVYLETPKYGGHTGFSGRKDGQQWYIHRIAEFIDQFIL